MTTREPHLSNPAQPRTGSSPLPRRSALATVLLASISRASVLLASVALCCLAAGLPAPAFAQVKAGAPATNSQATSSAPVQQIVPEDQTANVPGVLVDQVVAVVNGDVILESDVDEERRFESFQPLATLAGPRSRESLVERLIDRALILQQARVQPDMQVSDADVNAQIAELRKEIPACKRADCESDAGWKRFVEAQGFTLAQFTERWRQRMEILQFIELRFQSGITIAPAEIKTYYDKTLLPEYAHLNASAPRLDVIAPRIQELLLQQQVSNLLADWLKSLKAQGTVRIMRPGEIKP